MPAPAGFWHRGSSPAWPDDDVVPPTTHHHDNPHCTAGPLQRLCFARLIQKVYEVDPLECPNCVAAMRIIALIDEPAIIERILKHLKVWDPGPAPIQPTGRDPPWPQGENLPLSYQPVPDIA